MEKSEVLALFDAIKGITGPLCGHYEGDRFVNDEKAVAATWKALHGEYAKIQAGLKANPELLDDKDVALGLAVIAVNRPTDFTSQGAEDCLKENVRRKKDPEAKKEAATNLLFSLMNMQDPDGTKIIDPDNVPKFPAKLSSTQEELVKLSMRAFLDTPRPKDPVAMLSDKEWTRSAEGCFAEETGISNRRLWNFGNWLEAVAASTGRGCGIGRTMSDYTSRINNLLKNRGSDLCVKWQSSNPTPPPPPEPSLLERVARVKAGEKEIP